MQDIISAITVLASSSGECPWATYPGDDENGYVGMRTSMSPMIEKSVAVVAFTPTIL